MTRPMEPVLVIESLSARSERDGTALLHDVSLQIGPGDVHGLVGESGAGKSTVAKAVLGILPAGVRITGGAIRLDGRDVLRLSPRTRRELGGAVALIPQDPLTALNPGRRIEGQLTDGLRLWRGLSRREARQRALALLDEVRIREPERVLAAYPHELSGGMRQRVLIAAAFALKPKLIVADEPTTALDVTVQREILRLMRAMQERHGTGVLFVTHDLGIVAQVATTTTLLFGGRVVEQGATAELVAAPRHPYTRALLAAAPRLDSVDALRPVPAEVIAALHAEVAAGCAADRAAGG